MYITAHLVKSRDQREGINAFVQRSTLVTRPSRAAKFDCVQLWVVMIRYGVELALEGLGAQQLEMLVRSALRLLDAYIADQR